MDMETGERPDYTLHGLDIGGRNNGSVRGLWEDARIPVEWTVLDIQNGEDVDIVADASVWAPDQNYDVVLCTEVLEHSQDWRYIVHTAMHALAPNGHLILTCAGPGREPHNMTDGGPITNGEHYDNILPQSLAEQLSRGGRIGWRTLTYDPVAGDVYAYMVRVWRGMESFDHDLARVSLETSRPADTGPDEITDVQPEFLTPDAGQRS